MRSQQRAAVFGRGAALNHRFEQIAADRQRERAKRRREQQNRRRPIFAGAAADNRRRDQNSDRRAAAENAFPSFFGLIDDSGRAPKSRPPKNAPESVAHTTANAASKTPGYSRYKTAAANHAASGNKSPNEASGNDGKAKRHNSQHGKNTPHTASAKPKNASRAAKLSSKIARAASAKNANSKTK